MNVSRCVFCDQPAVAEALVSLTPTGRGVCEACLWALTAKKFRAQDARVAANMAAHQARVRTVVATGADVARDGGEF